MKNIRIKKNIINFFQQAVNSTNSVIINLKLETTVQQI